jgi:putative transposase
MIGALKQMEAGRKAEDVAREVGVSKHTIYAWKAKYGGMDVSQAQEAKQLREENTRLRKLAGGPPLRGLQQRWSKKGRWPIFNQALTKGWPTFALLFFAKVGRIRFIRHRHSQLGVLVSADAQPPQALLWRQSSPVRDPSRPLGTSQWRIRPSKQYHSANAPGAG